MQHIISDVHGCYHTLVSLLKKVRDYDSNPKFVFVGDYPDRGLHTKQAVDLIIQMRENEGAICLRGNHDDVVDYILNEESQGNMKEHLYGEPTAEKAVIWFLRNGLWPTMESYGMDSFHSNIVDAFRAAVPDSHKKFFNSLEMFWENDTHFACHAFMRPYEKLPKSFKFMSRDRNNETLWSRFEAGYDISSFKCGLAFKKPVLWDKIGVFGHTPVSYYGSPTPVKHDKIRLIDTGSFTGESMCAYNCDEDDWILQPTDRRDIDKE